MQLSLNCKAVWDRTDRSLKARALRVGLSVLGCGYAGLMRGRNWLYDRDWLKQIRLDAKVLCVGNITAGGTGKTPMVIWLARQLRQRGKRLAILTRGYKGDADDSDEVRLIREALPEVPVMVDADRVRGGRRAIDEYRAEFLLLDDGFQHRRLRRDADIVLIDCLCSFGYGAVLPGGLLREPLTGLRRARAIVLTRSDLVSAAELAVIRERVKALAPAAAIYTCRHEPTGLISARGERLTLETLRGQNVAALCGIGNPPAFTATLERLGAIVAARRFYDDHYDYTPEDVAEIKALVRDYQWAATTDKDWVKLVRLPGITALDKLVRVQIEAVIDRGEELIAVLDV